MFCFTSVSLILLSAIYMITFAWLFIYPAKIQYKWNSLHFHFQASLSIKLCRQGQKDKLLFSSCWSHTYKPGKASRSWTDAKTQTSRRIRESREHKEGNDREQWTVSILTLSFSLFLGLSWISWSTYSLSFWFSPMWVICFLITAHVYPPKSAHWHAEHCQINLKSLLLI